MDPFDDTPRDGGGGLVEATDAVAAVDARGLVTAWSPGAGRLLGYEPSDVIGRPAFLLLAGDPPAAALRHAAAALSWSGRLELRHQDGHRLEADLRAWSALDADGQPQWFLTHSPHDASHHRT